MHKMEKSLGPNAQQNRLALERQRKSRSGLKLLLALIVQFVAHHIGYLFMAKSDAGSEKGDVVTFPFAAAWHSVL